MYQPRRGLNVNSHRFHLWNEIRVKKYRSFFDRFNTPGQPLLFISHLDFCLSFFNSEKVIMGFQKMLNNRKRVGLMVVTLCVSLGVAIPVWSHEGSIWAHMTGIERSRIIRTSLYCTKIAKIWQCHQPNDQRKFNAQCAETGYIPRAHVICSRAL